jgi:hypothetical protein
MKKTTPKFFVTTFLLVLSVNCFRTFAQPTLIYTPFIQNLAKPNNVKNARDGSGRLFVIEQYGKIKIIRHDSVLSQSFLDISKKVDTGTYKGIWSIAFPADYTTTKNFYVFYIDAYRNTKISRFTTSSSNPDSALPASESGAYFNTKAFKS